LVLLLAHVRQALPQSAVGFAVHADQPGWAQVGFRVGWVGEAMACVGGRESRDEDGWRVRVNRQTNKKAALVTQAAFS
jgi:hypothetical protein